MEDDPRSDIQGVDLKQALMAVKLAQSDRAMAYATWNQWLGTLTRGECDIPAYSAACTTAHRDLQRASTTIIQQITLLKSSRVTTNWGFELQKLQDLERQKLDLTIQHIAIRCGQSKFDDNDPNILHKDRQLRKKLAAVVEGINSILLDIEFDLH